MATFKPPQEKWDVFLANSAGQLLINGPLPPRESKISQLFKSRRNIVIQQPYSAPKLAEAVEVRHERHVGLGECWVRANTVRGREQRRRDADVCRFQALAGCGNAEIKTPRSLIADWLLGGEERIFRLQAGRWKHSEAPLKHGLNLFEGASYRRRRGNHFRGD